MIRLSESAPDTVDVLLDLAATLQADEALQQHQAIRGHVLAQVDAALRRLPTIAVNAAFERIDRDARQIMDEIGTTNVRGLIRVLADRHGVEVQLDA